MKNIVSIIVFSILLLALGFVAFTSAPGLVVSTSQPPSSIMAAQVPNEEGLQQSSPTSAQVSTNSNEITFDQEMVSNNVKRDAASFSEFKLSTGMRSEQTDENKSTSIAQEEISATLRFAESSYTVAPDAFNVADLVVDGADRLAAWEAVLVFDDTLLAVSEITSTGFLTTTGRSVVTLGPLTDSPGQVAIGGYSYGNQGGSTGGGVLAQITFDGLAEGQTTVELTDILLATDVNGLPGTQPAIGQSTIFTVDADPQPPSQTIPISGWSMISSYIQPADPLFANVIDPVASKLVLAKNGRGEVYWPAYTIDQIGQWTAVEGYQVYVSQSTTLTITGTIIDPAQTPIDLTAGWNLAAYLRETPHPIGDALASISTELLLVKDGDGNVYWPEFLIDGIGEMQPGNGYQMYLTEPGVLTYPANE